MSDVSHLLQSDFLNGEEIPTPTIVTIKGSEIKELGDEKEQKVVLSFNELDKQLPCNKTRLKAMVKHFGPETSQWTGQRVMIYGQELVSGKFQGKWTVVLSKAPDIPAPSQPAAQEGFSV